MDEEIILNAVVQMELPHRANVMVRKFNDKTIVIYDDHRWILNVLFYLREKNLNLTSFLLVHLLTQAQMLKGLF